MTTDKRLQFQIRLSDTESAATIWSLADLERVTHQLVRKTHGITSNEQKQFKMEFSIRLIEFEAWWETIGIQAFRRTIEQRVINYGYPKMHLVHHNSESIRRMGSGHNLTPDISEWLDIANVKEPYRSRNTVNDIRQRLKPNDWCTGLDYMEETLPYLALEGWNDINLAKVSTHCPLLITGEVHAQPICYISKEFRTSPLSALYYSRYIIGEKSMFAECAEVSD